MLGLNSPSMKLRTGINLQSQSRFVDFSGDDVIAIIRVGGYRVIKHRTFQQMELAQFSTQFYQSLEGQRVWIRYTRKVYFINVYRCKPVAG
jgi:hypothetical protein